MIGWDGATVAATAGASLIAGAQPGASGPRGVEIDSRALQGGELFVGLVGERTDGGEHAEQALAAGAWGVLVRPVHARRLMATATKPAGAVLEHSDPLAGLQALAHGWREQLGACGTKVLAITGSTGKTSTKDILAAILGQSRRTTATPANLNTEIGLPLAVLAAPQDCECLVLEMAMRGAGQIAELTAIADPDVGVIVNVGEAHLELLGSLAAIAAAKAEVIAGMRAGTVVVVPHDEPLLQAHLRADLETVSFGEGGDVRLLERAEDGTVNIDDRGRRVQLRPSFAQAHNLSNLLAAVAAADAVGVHPSGVLEVRFSAQRGERVELSGGVVLIDDCYNANPMSMTAAIDDLAASARGRRVAVLGDMLELGEGSAELHRRIGARAAQRDVGLLVTVGPLAAEMAARFDGQSHAVADAVAAARLLPRLLEDGDTVLVKGSRGVGLERVVSALREHDGTEPHGDAALLAPAAGRRRR